MQSKPTKHTFSFKTISCNLTFCQFNVFVKGDESKGVNVFDLHSRSIQDIGIEYIPKKKFYLTCN